MVPGLAGGMATAEALALAAGLADVPPLAAGLAEAAVLAAGFALAEAPDAALLGLAAALAGAAALDAGAAEGAAAPPHAARRLLNPNKTNIRFIGDILNRQPGGSLRPSTRYPLCGSFQTAEILPSTSHTMFDKLEALEARYDELNELMATASPEQLAEYGRELASIEEVVSLYRQFKATRKEIDETEGMLRGEQDEDLRELAKEELQTLRERQEGLEQDLKMALVPKDPNDEKNVIVEVRAGAGGDEAAIFAADLYRMYTRYAENRRWTVELLSANENGVHGFKEVIFEVRGRGAYSRLKFEGGVHRVQRIPVTESGGRIHTSTATVAVMPEAEEVDVNIREEDLRVDVYRSTGHGGQSVNTTDSAVRITHLPTGLVVTCQDEKSQLKNKNKAMMVLRSRLLEMEQAKHDAEMGALRRSMVQTGDRSEKIRTYNFPQDRVTDHRINVSIHNLPGVMEGNIDALIDQLTVADQAEKLSRVAA